MIDLDRLKLQGMALACVLLAVGWANTFAHTRTLVAVTEVAQEGGWQCVDVVLVKLDSLRAGIADENQRVFLEGSRAVLGDKP